MKKQELKKKTSVKNRLISQDSVTSVAEPTPQSSTCRNSKPSSIAGISLEQIRDLEQKISLMNE